MKIKFREIIVDSKDEPVMVILTPEEKKLIGAMEEQTKFCIYPAGSEPEEIRAFMHDGRAVNKGDSVGSEEKSGTQESYKLHFSNIPMNVTGTEGDCSERTISHYPLGGGGGPVNYERVAIMQAIADVNRTLTRLCTLLEDGTISVSVERK